jgi:PAS domain S-box-containing protein
MDGRTGQLVEVNPRTEALLGMSREQLIGRTPAALSPPTQPDGRSSHDASRELLRRGLDGDRPVFEWTLERSDGSTVLTQVHLARLPPENEALVCASIVDISERQRAERELRRSEEKYRTLVNAIQDGVFIIQDGKMAFANEPFASMIGYSIHDVLGEPFIRFVAPEDRAMVTDRYQRRQDGEDVPSEYELRMLHRNGLTRVYVNMTVDLTEIRGTTATIGTVKDFTERRAAEELLRASERRYRLLFERNLAGVYRAHTDGRLIDCNRAFAQMLGYGSPEAALASWQFDFQSYEGQQLLSTLSVDREIRDHETTLQRVDGTTVHLLENAIWFVEDTREEPTILGTVIDITERRRIEDELHQAQKLQAIGRLAGGVAHDFSNLLQAILATAETLAVEPVTPETVRAAVTELRSDVERGNDLARQLLLFARRGSSKLVHIDLNEAARDSLKLLRRVIQANVRLDVDLADTPLRARADPGQLEQVLVNLVLNASDAMEGGGRITIRCGGSSSEVWIDVADSGPGIPDAIRDRVFEPFFTTKDSSEGTGLGLAVAHGIVARHGGGLTILDTGADGTTFRLALPRSDATAERAPAPGQRAAASPGRGERVLLVEDEPATRSGIERLLVSLGFQVTAVATAEEALAVPHEPSHHLLLTDLLLPGADGLTLAGALAERWPELPVVLMSGYSHTEPPADTPFLHKPFTTSQLAEVLRTALDRQIRSA